MSTSTQKPIDTTKCSCHVDSTTGEGHSPYADKGIKKKVWIDANISQIKSCQHLLPSPKILTICRLEIHGSYTKRDKEPPSFLITLPACTNFFYRTGVLPRSSNHILFLVKKKKVQEDLTQLSWLEISHPTSLTLSHWVFKFPITCQPIKHPSPFINSFSASAQYRHLLYIIHFKADQTI